MSELQVFRYRDESGTRCIIARDARKYIHAVSIDSPIAVRKVPRSEQRFMTPLDMPLKAAAKRFRKAGKTLGITKGARKFLRGV